MMDTILPLKARAAGLRYDTAAGKSMAPARLDLVQAPTLIISARDDRYGPSASAEHMAARIAGARFLGFETGGGHTWTGHNEDVMDAIAGLIKPSGAAGGP